MSRYSRHQKFLFGATLQSRRWLMEQRLEAVEQNDMRQLTELFSSKRPFRPAELTTALETAVLKKSDEYSLVIELLLEKGANPGGVNGLGTPFLYIAADAGCEVVVELLLRANGDPNQCKDDGSTALHRAVWNDHRGIVDMLIQAGADLEQRDVQGRTPLILATQRQQNEVLVQLLKAGANQGATDKKGRGGLYWSAQCDSTENILSLLNCDVDVDAQDINHYTALMVAAERGFSDIVEILLDHDAETDIDSCGLSALMLATMNQHCKCVQLLIDFGADVTVQDESGASPLLYLMAKSELVYHLLEAGADPSTTVQSTGQTAVLIAVADNSYASLKILLQLNCDFLSVAAKGSRLPLDDALRRGYFECVQLLYVASASVGADLNWLRAKVLSMSVDNSIRSGSQVARCYHWLSKQMSMCDTAPSLFNFTRGKLRKCIDPIFFEDNIEGLPIPKVLQTALKLQELDDLVVSSETSGT